MATMKFFRFVFFFCVTFAGFLFYSTPAQAVSISNINVVSPTVRVYEKYEVKFDVATVATNTFFQYDTAPPPGVTAGTGITVEGVFTANGKTWRHPAFYMTETITVGSGSSQYYEETGKKYWVVRFSPQEVGTYQVSLTARDSGGTTTVSAGNFTATTPVKKGFIKVSDADTRYFEYSNGDIYFPIGPIQETSDYTQFKDSGPNLERPWMGGRGIYSTNWARWKSTAEQHGNEGIATRLNWREKAPGSDLSYEFFYPAGYRTWLTPWLDDQFGPRLKQGKTYQVKLMLKTTNIAGPRNSAFPYGFVIRDAPAQWGDMPIDQFEINVRNAPKIVNHIVANQTWRTVTGTYTAAANTDSIYLYLDNVTAGQVYVDEFSMREVLSGGALGGEIIRNPKADMHTYVEQRPAAFIDWQITQGELNNVYFKYVVHDKNDWIQNHLKTDGTWADVGDGYYQSENTKARWVLKQWYRYLVARWGYSTAIHSWELNNEGPPNEVANSTAPHWDTAQAFARFIHQTNAHPQMATTSFWCCWRPRFFGNNTLFPDIDYADLHEYVDNIEGGWVPDSTYDLAMWTYNTSIAAYNNGYPAGQKGVGKPLMRAETGIKLSAAGVDQLRQNNPGIWFHNLLWGQLNYGAMFDSGYWWGEHFAAINETQISKPFYLFVKDLDLNKGGYVDIAATSSNSKLRVFGQKNLSKKTAHLWIQNADHTWKKVMDGVTSSQTGTISVALNPGVTYTVERWNTYTGVPLAPTTIAANSSGIVAIPISSLTDDTAFKLKVSGPQPSINPSVSPCNAQGDINHDCMVNSSDIKLIFQNWGLLATNCGSFTCDVFTDEKINNLDAAVVRF